MQHELMSVTEVATAFNIGYATIWRLVKKGTIPSVRIGNQYRVHRTYVESLLAAPASPAPTTPTTPGSRDGGGE